MALSASAQTKVRAAIHRAYCAAGVAVPWTKPDIDAAIDALDTFLDTNAATINLALPQPFRSLASTGDKAVLLTAVTAAQYLADNPSLAAVFAAVASEVQDVAEG